MKVLAVKASHVESEVADLKDLRLNEGAGREGQPFGQMWVRTGANLPQ